MKILMLVLFFCVSLFAVDINKASKTELAQLNGIGPKKAERIVQYRADNQCFKSKEELLNVKGIGKGLLEKNSAIITLSACK